MTQNRFQILEENGNASDLMRLVETTCRQQKRGKRLGFTAVLSLIFLAELGYTAFMIYNHSNYGAKSDALEENRNRMEGDLNKSLNTTQADGSNQTCSKKYGDISIGCNVSNLLAFCFTASDDWCSFYKNGAPIDRICKQILATACREIFKLNEEQNKSDLLGGSMTAIIVFAAFALATAGAIYYVNHYIDESQALKQIFNNNEINTINFICRANNVPAVTADNAVGQLLQNLKDAEKTPLLAVNINH